MTLFQKAPSLTRLLLLVGVDFFLTGDGVEPQVKADMGWSVLIGLLLYLTVIFVVGWWVSRSSKKKKPTLMVPPTIVLNQFFRSPIRFEKVQQPQVSSPLTSDFVRETLRTAFQMGRDIEIAYTDKNQQTTRRVITILWIGQTEIKAHQRSNLNLFKGFCHLRQEPRTFRIDRVQAIQVLKTQTKGHCT